MKLIDLAQAKRKLRYIAKSYGLNDSMVQRLNTALSNCPTIDAVPVVHGRWEQAIDIDTGILVGFRCSKCDVQEAFMSAYCRFCGAKMDKEEPT